MKTCNDCVAFRGDRCTHPDGRTAAAFYHEACALFVQPLTPAERAELTRLQAWRANLGPYALIAVDDRMLLRLLELEARAG
jgi:hypothetical protein